MRLTGAIAALAAILLATLACNTPGIVGTPEPESTVTATPMAEPAGDGEATDEAGDAPLTEEPTADTTDDAGDANSSDTDNNGDSDDSTACEPDSTFVEDVTIPDGTEVAQGESVVKTWLLRNDGTCAWDGSYQLVQIGGSALLADGPVALPAVASDDEAEINVTVTLNEDAPIGSEQRATFQIQTPDGETFGATPFVEVIVAEAEEE